MALYNGNSSAADGCPNYAAGEETRASGAGCSSAGETRGTENAQTPIGSRKDLAVFAALILLLIVLLR